MWNKKAEAPAGLVFRFGVFYLPLSLAIAVALVTIPTTIMGGALQPVPLDQSIQSQQLKARLWETNQFTGRTNPFSYTDNLEGISETIARKQFAYSIEIDGQITYHNKQFYDIAKPIAPFRYQKYIESKDVMVKGTKKKLTIEEYYPYDYAIKK
ncbi:MAG: hypothetical protein QW165_03690 [Candidatus Woesearchaeota archaeon]